MKFHSRTLPKWDQLRLGGVPQLALGLGTLLMLWSCGSNTRSCGYAREEVVIVHLTDNPESFNPVTSNESSASYINNRLLFQTLLQIDPKTIELVPCLAISRPTFSADGLDMQWELHPDARWDDGSPILAEDVIFSLKVVFTPRVKSNHKRPYLETIRDISIDTENPRKFIVHTREVYILSEDALGTELPIIPKKYYDPKGLLDAYRLDSLLSNDAQYADDPAIRQFVDEFHTEKYMREPGFVNGSGPYDLVEWVTSQKIVLKKKENWWADKLEGRPYDNDPPMIVFRIITDGNAAEMALKREEIDIYNSIPASRFITLREDKRLLDRFEFATPRMLAYYYLGMNMKPPAGRPKIFGDKLTRRAIAHLLDVDKIIDKLVFGMGNRVTGPILPTVPGIYNDTLKPIPYDITKARQLLAQAGWKDTNGDGTLDKMIDGKRVEFVVELMVNQGNASRNEIGLLLTDAAKQVGIKVNIRAYEWTIFLERMSAHEFDLYIGGWITSPGPQDPKQIWGSENWANRGSNYVGFGDKNTDDLIERLRRTLDEKERNDLYWQFQARVYDEQPYVFLFETQNRLALASRFDQPISSLLRPGYHAAGMRLAPTNL